MKRVVYSTHTDGVVHDISIVHDISRVPSDLVSVGKVKVYPEIFDHKKVSPRHTVPVKPHDVHVNRPRRACWRRSGFIPPKMKLR
jgi:hypothetical protein